MYIVQNIVSKTLFVGELPLILCTMKCVPFKWLPWRNGSAQDCKLPFSNPASTSFANCIPV